MNNMTLLDPKNDFVFKKLFSEAPDLLAELINAVRFEYPPIQVVEVLNPTIEPEELAGKYIVLDILAQDNGGKRYNIEMQIRRYDMWNARSAFYLARTLSQQLSSGEDYHLLKPVIGIHLLDFELFQQKEHQEQAVWCFEMRDRVKSEVRLGEELQLNIIELPKADRLGTAKESLVAWITFFEHWYEELKMAEINYPPVKSALEKVKMMSADEQTQRLAFVRERALKDEASLLRSAKEEGIELGKSELLLQMLEFKFGALPSSVSESLSTAKPEQLDHWAKMMLQCDRLEDIFQH